MKQSTILIWVVLFLLIVIGVFLYIRYTPPVAPLSDVARCAWTPEKGTCKAYIPRYYFDASGSKCKEFIWGGCGGVVPFETLNECKAMCE